MNHQVKNTREIIETHLDTIHTSNADNKPILYIAGSMTGLEDKNRKAFEFWDKHFTELGYYVFNPINNIEEGDNGENKTYAEYFRRDVPMLLLASHIFLIPGWEQSRGTTAECLLAKRLDLIFIDATGLRVDSPNIKETAHQSVKEVPLSQDDELDILDEARKLVTGDRRRDYAHPHTNFKLTTDMLNLLGFSYQGKDLEPEHLSDIMVILKIARNAHQPKKDGFIDMVGYLYCRELVLDKKLELEKN